MENKQVVLCLPVFHLSGCQGFMRLFQCMLWALGTRIFSLLLTQLSPLPRPPFPPVHPGY